MKIKIIFLHMSLQCLYFGSNMNCPSYDFLYSNYRFNHLNAFYISKHRKRLNFIIFLGFFLFFSEC